ncbi:acyl-CoA dehydrogenase, partial [Saccharomonospora sp. NPDC046836]|uniref:acyl-CoA dehydrogenase family protein n=1 Tax=Saccharomonospora sp. NPDC046836 TaxID=3156921 RepID=UPI0033EB0A15
RFNIQRVIGESGTRALDFVTHQSELYSALARVYATQLFTERVRREFIAERRGESTPKPAKAAISADYAPWVAAYRERTLVKVAAAETLEAVAATCRRLCGFQGVLHANRLSVFEDMARSFHAAGGDSRLLLLEAGKQLLGADAGVPSLPGALGTGIGDARSALRLVSRHERMLTGELAARVERAGGAGRLDVHGWNPHLPQLEELARVHITRRILEEFDEAIASGEDSWREAMDAVRCLYGIDVLLKSAAWHLNHGSLRPGDLDVLRYAHTNAVGRVGRSLDSLLDGLAVPPGRVGGFIGRTDYVSRVASLLQ